MPLYLCVEQEYIASSWCSEIMDGLLNEKRRKKLKITTVNNISDIPEDNGDEISSVILIGSRHNWIAEHINQVIKINMNPIVVGNTPQNSVYTKYSNVSSDIFGAVGEAMELCRSNGHKNIALYGINPDSAPDSMRKNAFLTFGGSKKDIYYNQGLLKGCFYSIISNIDQYDAIICANDFAAVSLINRMNKENVDCKNIYIISFIDSLLCSAFSPKITSFSINFKKFASAAVSIHETLSKNKYISSLNTLISYDLNLRETTDCAVIKEPLVGYFSPDPEQNINIYTDPEISEMIAAESLLKNSDISDFVILKMLNKNQNLEAISEKTYLSTSAIKYRIKNMCKLFEVNTNADLLCKIAKYVDINSFDIKKDDRL